MGYTRTHRADSNSCFVLPLLTRCQILGRFDMQIGVCYVRWIINWESKADHKVDHYDVIHGQVPVVDKGKQEEVYQNDGKEDEAGDGNTASDEQNYEEDSCDGQPNRKHRFFDKDHILLIV